MKGEMIDDSNFINRLTLTFSLFLLTFQEASRILSISEKS